LRAFVPAVSGFHILAFLRGGITAWTLRVAIASWYLRQSFAPSSALRSNKCHQLACYPLPRQIESDAAALGLDPDGVDCFEIMAGLHSLFQAARNAGVVQSDEAVTCADLLCSATIGAITRSDVLSPDAIRTARNRTKALQPDERYATPKHRWRTLPTQVRMTAEHKPQQDGSGERIPGVYIVSNEALEDDLGLEALTALWGRSALARVNDDRTRWSSLRQGLRLFRTAKSIGY